MRAYAAEPSLEFGATQIFGRGVPKIIDAVVAGEGSNNDSFDKRQFVG
jgi:hypothetical protein